LLNIRPLTYVGGEEGNAIFLKKANEKARVLFITGKNVMANLPLKGNDDFNLILPVKFS
jgi:hypothetical protein